MTKPKRDIHQEITDSILAAIEEKELICEMPWYSKSAGSIPVNARTNNAYNGINILSLWTTQMRKEYSSNLWGTYKQWAEIGGQVRKGEKSSIVIFYKTLQFADKDSDDINSIPMARASHVFNLAQVDGYELPKEEERIDQTTRLDNVERFVANTEATVYIGGSQAYYKSKDDTIHMPNRELFTGTKTSSPTESFYSVLLHELTHWTKHESRLNRNLSRRFGDEAYAMEELVAELGAAFLCAHLGISQEPRLDHSAYIKNWLKVLKNDKKAIFSASAKANEAVTHLKKLQETKCELQAA